MKRAFKTMRNPPWKLQDAFFERRMGLYRNHRAIACANPFSPHLAEAAGFRAVDQERDSDLLLYRFAEGARDG